MASPEIPQKPAAPLLRRNEAAAYVARTYGIPCATRTLARLAVVGGGPAFRKAGPFPLYAMADLDGWASGKLGPLVRTTSETREAA